ncbi:(2Fe-2S)-binding protein [Halobacteriales archaeon QS_5_70_17]|jgi:nitrite reductase/ring-hydroxylating ferredoxin subunit|nr:MAG: (2Fe-2S)-binding protein [Halobacteriales archaeon QS_5_70_17]
MTGSRIATVDEVPADGSFLFTLRRVEDGEEREAVLLRLEDGIAGWLNYCQHFTHIRLDKGSGAPVRDGEVVCANHGAMFEKDTGLCTYGPCEGAYLNPVDLEVRDGTVYLADEEFEFVRVGPTERDPTDLSSKSNIEF